MTKVDNPYTIQSLTDVLSDIASYLESAQRLTQNPGAGVHLANALVDYCADYAKTTANRVNQEEAQS
ncbi:hypothetical protein [Yersinia enterocolitica]|uniref:hypothetical protein n=1 Tax=Yersinia enterocolitica TaxID=630 RepID=UPI003F489122